MHVRLNVVTADPTRIPEAVAFIETEARDRIERQVGNLGMALHLYSEVGVAVVESYWVSGDAMRESEKPVIPIREELARRATGTVAVEHYRVASLVQVSRPQAGGGVRLTRAENHPSAVDAAIAAYEDMVLPWLYETDGFCGAHLYVDRNTGRSISETIWKDPTALAASRSAAAAIRVDAVAATGSAIRAVEEYRLAFTSVRPD